MMPKYKIISVLLLLTAILTACGTDPKKFWQGVEKEDIDIVKEYIRQNSNEILKKTNSDGYTPFCLAVKNRQKEITDFLLETDSTFPDQYMDSMIYPWQIAADNGHDELAADLLRKMNDGLAYAIRKGYPDIVRIILEKHTYEENPVKYDKALEATIESGGTDLAYRLIDEGCNIFYENEYGQNFVCLAANFSEDTELLQYLLDKGVLPNPEGTLNALQSAVLSSKYRFF